MLATAIIDVSFDRSGKPDTSKWTCAWFRSVCLVLTTLLQDTPLSRAVLLLVIGLALRDKRSMYWFGKLVQVTCFVNHYVPVQASPPLEVDR